MDYVTYTPEVRLSSDDAESLFGNIKEIYHFNRCVVRYSHVNHTVLAERRSINVFVAKRSYILFFLHTDKNFDKN